MKYVVKNSGIAIVDNLLAVDQSYACWQRVQSENFVNASSQGWVKVWRLCDGSPMISDSYSNLDESLPSEFRPVLRLAIRAAAENPQIVGVRGTDWNDVVCRVFLYPRGCRLSWHLDSHGYSGAFIYYAHPIWRSGWGGELLVADMSKRQKLDRLSRKSLEADDIEQAVLEQGVGQFIMPKPNRLVLLKAGKCHMLARVDPDAGDNVRVSIGGFFTRVAAT
jgi:Rps23 Pro-64 3,4-dihydroxylase Tpa1-like proline 4-hydroxylase